MTASACTPDAVGYNTPGVALGKRLGHFFESKIEIVVGVILIAIGLKILVEHLTA